VLRTAKDAKKENIKPSRVLPTRVEPKVKPGGQQLQGKFQITKRCQRVSTLGCHTGVKLHLARTVTIWGKSVQLAGAHQAEIKEFGNAPREP
jgi:hypothetical protein